MKINPHGWLCHGNMINYRPGFWFLEIFSDKASKQNAVKHLREAYSFERIIGFGDNLNDLPMFAACDVRVAVENAKPEVKTAANTICDTNNNDGVAKWLEETVLIWQQSILSPWVEIFEAQDDGPFGQRRKNNSVQIQRIINRRLNQQRYFNSIRYVPYIIINELLQNKNKISFHQKSYSHILNMDKHI